MLKVINTPLILGCNTPGCDLNPPLFSDLGFYEALKHNNIDFSILKEIPIDNTFTDLPKQAKNLDKEVVFNNSLFDLLKAEVNPNDRFVNIGGDHSSAIGAIFASNEIYEDLAVVYIDAHADSNSPEISPSGNIHGMPLSTVMGDSLYPYFQGKKIVPKENVVILGAKDVDPKEWEYLNDNKITVYTINDFIELGLNKIINEITERFKSKSIHVSFDIDSLDHSIAPGTGIINHGGISYREIKYIFNKLSQMNLKAVDMVEINPLRDTKSMTTKLGIELTIDLFGGQWSEYDKYLAEHK